MQKGRAILNAERSKRDVVTGYGGRGGIFGIEKKKKGKVAGEDYGEIYGKFLKQGTGMRNSRPRLQVGRERAQRRSNARTRSGRQG